MTETVESNDLQAKKRDLLSKIPNASSDEILALSIITHNLEAQQDFILAMKMSQQHSLDLKIQNQQKSNSRRPSAPAMPSGMMPQFSQDFNILEQIPYFS